MQLLLDEAQATVDSTNLTGPQVDWKRNWETVQAEAAGGSGGILLFERETE